MQSLINLTTGLKIINPFLNEHSFYFDKYEKDSDSSGEYFIGSYKNQQKKIHYRLSLFHWTSSLSIWKFNSKSYILP